MCQPGFSQHFKYRDTGRGRFPHAKVFKDILITPLPPGCDVAGPEIASNLPGVLKEGNAIFYAG